MKGVTILDHPLVQHKLTVLRDKTTSTRTFRAVTREISLLIGYEVTRDLPLTLADIETPIGPTRSPVIEGKKLVFAPILRSGMGMLDGMLELVPSARVAHVGLYRDPETLGAVEYYYKAPADIAERVVVVLDPMLATGHTAVAAIDRLKEQGASTIRFACLLSARQGVETVRGAHPDVPVWTAAMDEHLDDHGYIVPGLGDAGDRIYGTR